MSAIGTLSGFIRLTLRNFEADEWHASNVRTSDIVRVAEASESAKQHITDAGAELAVMSGGALCSRESAAEVLERITGAERRAVEETLALIAGAKRKAARDDD